MAVRILLALAAVTIVAVVDAWILRRIFGVYRRTGRQAHLWICAGIVASGVVTFGGAGVFALAGEPAPGPWWPAARAAVLIGAPASYGLVALFTASAFRPRSAKARALAWSLLGIPTALGLVAVFTEPLAVAAPFSVRYSLRIPTVLLGVAAPLWAAREALRLVAHHRARPETGSSADRLALARMQTFGLGSMALASSQVPFLGYPPHESWNTPLGWAGVAFALGAALLFVLGCHATWATPEWLRRRWTAGGAVA